MRLQLRLPRSSNLVRNSKRDHIEARFRFERLFYNRRLTKVKIKNIHNIQLSARVQPTGEGLRELKPLP